MPLFRGGLILLHNQIRTYPQLQGQGEKRNGIKHGENEMMTATNPTKWQKGVSGNPAGRPKGAGKIAQLREQIGEALPTIINGLIEQAKKGDSQAARLLLDKAMPSLRAVLPSIEPADEPTHESLIKQAENTLARAMNGELSPDQAAALLASMGAVAKLTETIELQQRIENLESILKART